MTSRQLDEEAIFHIARELTEPAKRVTYLDQVCGGDQALRERVEGLLDMHGKNTDLLKSANDPVAVTVGVDTSIERAGNIIGRYTLREQIGEGGMGSVFVAEQERPIRRKVALKVIKPGMDSKSVIARFEAERQALAMMDHPNIAKVLDAGTTESGRPYFAMELVKGVPITEYCDANRLTIPERLELFVTVCQAIQHAHHKGIIHRDIKPSNVLVTLHDGKPVPKVIDFGVAKALNTRLTDKTIYTEHLQVVGTLLYMSPEQAELSGLDIDTRSDIYSLGVLLYELLTGTTPFQKGELDKAGIDEQRRIIRDKEPPRASVRISSLGETATSVAEHRKTDAKRLHQVVSGDLDWIIFKTLEKDRTRRYASANELSDDVSKYLNNELVEARPPSTAYKIQKLWARNRALISTGSAVIMLLSIGLAIMSWLYFEMKTAQAALREEREKDLARAERSEGILKKLWEVLADRALDATFRGDYDEAQIAIEEARAAEAPQEITDTLEGLALFFDGKGQDAIQRLEEALNENPNSLTVQAALCWAYLHEMMHGKHEEMQQRLRSTEPSVSDELRVYEDLFLCLSSYLDGSSKEMHENLALAKSIIDRKRHWGAAWIIRSHLYSELAKEEHSLDYCRLAYEDYQEARTRLGDHSIANSMGLFALLTTIELADQKGIPTDEWITEAEALTQTFDTDSSDQFGMHLATVYLYRQGRHDRARELEDELIKRAERGSIMWTSEVADFSKARLPHTQSQQGASEVENRISKAISIAASNPTDTDKLEARQIVQRLIEEPDLAAAYFVIAMDVACILGDQDLAKQILTKSDSSKSVKTDWRWWQRMLDFYAGRIDEQDLVDQAEPFSGCCSCVYYVIAMKALLVPDLENNREKARTNFNKTIGTGTVTFWSYHSAKAWVRRLESGNWPAR